MNPLLITGILAVSVFSFAMMLSFSNEQLQYSNTAQKVSNMQAQRIQEKVSVTIQDDKLLLKNTGPIPVNIMEIRVLDENGQLVTRQKTDLSISSASTVEITPDVEIFSNLGE